jgi:polysaccharide export outer membrane protein
VNQSFLNCLRFTFWLLLFCSVVSCVPAKKLKYFNDIDQLEDPIVNPKEEKTISPFDRLYIQVLSIDERTNQLFNSNQSGSGGGNFMVTYPVDAEGNIYFPFAGKINVSGLLISEASTKIQTTLNDYVSKTTVTVRIVENKITIMGQVQREGVYNFPQDKINIYEALALGGGITQFGDRKKVVLIRQEGEKITHYVLDLSDSKISSKHYYYLMPNDVLIVEPMNIATRSFNIANVQTAITMASALFTLYLLFQTRIAQ